MLQSCSAVTKLCIANRKQKLCFPVKLRLCLAEFLFYLHWQRDGWTSHIEILHKNCVVILFVLSLFTNAFNCQDHDARMTRKWIMNTQRRKRKRRGITLMWLRTTTKKLGHNSCGAHPGFERAPSNAKGTFKHKGHLPTRRAPSNTKGTFKHKGHLPTQRASSNIKGTFQHKGHLPTQRAPSNTKGTFKYKGNLQTQRAPSNTKGTFKHKGHLQTQRAPSNAKGTFHRKGHLPTQRAPSNTKDTFQHKGDLQTQRAPSNTKETFKHKGHFPTQSALSNTKCTFQHKGHLPTQIKTRHRLIELIHRFSSVVNEFLFILCLPNGVFSYQTTRTSSHYRPISVQQIWQTAGGSSRDLILTYFKDYHATVFEGLTNSIRNRTHDRWSPGRDLNPGPPTNAAMLPIRPRHSVSRNSTDNKIVDKPMYIKTSHTTYGVKRVQRTTFGSEREGAAAGWRWLCSDVYFSPFIITQIHEGKCGDGDMWQGKGRTALYAWFYGETRWKHRFDYLGEMKV